ncbi:hypothetical protein LLQ46_09205 [Rouxiella badensis]|nr:hypothetical protein [Rouxiella badensis]QII40696.1 hypothetical protein G3M83_19535 [Rouxiella badensis]QOI57769.1 hypothetical protein H2866_10585 [Rouxiella badensis subsp. acadiensis]
MIAALRKKKTNMSALIRSSGVSWPA